MKNSGQIIIPILLTFAAIGFFALSFARVQASLTQMTQANRTAQAREILGLRIERYLRSPAALQATLSQVPSISGCLSSPTSCPTNTQPLGFKVIAADQTVISGSGPADAVWYDRNANPCTPATSGPSDCLLRVYTSYKSCTVGVGTCTQPVKVSVVVESQLMNSNQNSFANLNSAASYDFNLTTPSASSSGGNTNSNNPTSTPQAGSPCVVPNSPTNSPTLLMTIGSSGVSGVWLYDELGAPHCCYSAWFGLPVGGGASTLACDGQLF